MHQGATDLITMFDSLKSPGPDPEEIHFSANPLPNRRHDFLAKGRDGQPALLISACGATEVRPPSIGLQHLMVDHGLECRVRQETGAAITGTFSVVRCVDADRLLQGYFLRALVPVIDSLPAAPSYSDIARPVNALAELFRRLALPARKPIQGLWAELCMIAISRDPNALIAAWHATPEDRYDFSAASERIEVKSSSGSVRVHHFSFEQLNPPECVRILVASVFANEAGNGTSVFDLVDKIRYRVNHEAQLVERVDQIVAATLGSSWRHAGNVRFDFEEATSSLRYYEPSKIPSIRGPIPNGVSMVRYQSDLTAANPTALSSIPPSCQLLRALGEAGDSEEGRGES